jgi:hypothetical protein
MKTFALVAFVMLLGSPLALPAENGNLAPQPVAPTAAIRNEVLAAYKFVPAEANPASPTTAPSTTWDPDVSLAPIVLPKFIVEGIGGNLTKEDLLTPKATLDAAEGRYISPAYKLTFGPLTEILCNINKMPGVLAGWHPGEDDALTLYRQDERLEKLFELDADIDLEKIGGSMDAKELRQLRDEDYISSR